MAPPPYRQQEQLRRPRLPARRLRTHSARRTPWSDRHCSSTSTRTRRSSSASRGLDSPRLILPGTLLGVWPAHRSAPGRRPQRVRAHRLAQRRAIQLVTALGAAHYPGLDSVRADLARVVWHPLHEVQRRYFGQCQGPTTARCPDLSRSCQVHRSGNTGRTPGWCLHHPREPGVLRPLEVRTHRQGAAFRRRHSRCPRPVCLRHSLSEAHSARLNGARDWCLGETLLLHRSARTPPGASGRCRVWAAGRVLEDQSRRPIPPTALRGLQRRPPRQLPC